MTESTRTTTEPTAEPRPAAPAQRREPPKALFAVINPLMTALLRSPLHGLVSNSLLVLTFQGRKTGKVYRTPVGYHRSAADLLVFTHSPWFHNFRGGANVRLRWRGRDVPARAVVVEDEAVVFAHLLAILEQIGWGNAQRVGIMLPR